jgi:N-acetyl-alpha-D-muramate 1-phosphate uridylyltransferase
MRVMLLAAGRGERLRPLTDQTPKPLLPIAGKPLIAHQLGWLAAGGLTEIVINLHHLGDQIEGFCGDGRAFGVAVQYCG